MCFPVVPSLIEATQIPSLPDGFVVTTGQQHKSVRHMIVIYKTNPVCLKNIIPAKIERA